MAEKRSLIGESFSHLRAGNRGAARDIWAHEGLKTSVERLLQLSGRWAIGRYGLAHLVGEGTNSIRLHTSIGSLQLTGPTGLAPGWDKSGKTPRAWEALGARHITTGGIPLRPQKGKPMPRLRTFDNRLGDHGKRMSLNSYGFPSLGAEKTARNLAHQRELGLSIPLIAQVVPNAEMYEPNNRDRIPEEMAEAIRILIQIADPDAINLGLSSPNTNRDAQDEFELTYAITARAMDSVAKYSNRTIPVIYKGDGDGGRDRLDMYIRLAQQTGVALELINTTAKADIKGKYGAANAPGGLGGAEPAYQELALASVSYVYRQTHGEVPIIGMGGIDSPEQEYKMIRAGASAVGVNTVVRSLGHTTFRSLETGLFDLLPPGQSIPDIRGIDAGLSYDF